MSEIRRKLVIVGDGACGKVCCQRAGLPYTKVDYVLNTIYPLFALLFRLDLSFNRFLQRNVP